VWPSVPARLPRRAGTLPLLLVLVVAAWLTAPASAAADDSVPTAWMEQAGTAPLLHAPPPPVIPTICFIDTGITPTPDLDIADRTSLVGDDPNDVTAVPGQPGHGTTVAHFAAGKVNGWGGAGAFPHARVTSVRVFATAASGTIWQSYLRALDACRQRAHSTLRVVVMSIGGQSINANEAAELEDRVAWMRNRFDVNVVTAAGNGGAAADFPARFPESFAVAAVGSGDALCGFSARGESVDIAAPGCNVTQAGWDGATVEADGTSFAAPIVAGSLAAIRAYAPNLSAVDAENVLLATARPSSQEAPRVLNTSAALRAIGRADIVDAYRLPPQRSDALGTDGASDFPVAQPTSLPRGPHKRLAPLAKPKPTVERPRVTLKRRRKGRLELIAKNRPRRAIFEVKLGRRVIARESSRMTVRVRSSTSLTARFLTDEGTSSWRRIRITGR
jgi:hypothetical protein